eukprot:3396920-Pleurochrysis_carterae.AAC.1
MGKHVQTLRVLSQMRQSDSVSLPTKSTYEHGSFNRMETIVYTQLNMSTYTVDTMTRPTHGQDTWLSLFCHAERTPRRTVYPATYPNV